MDFTSAKLDLMDIDDFVKIANEESDKMMSKYASKLSESVESKSTIDITKYLKDIGVYRFSQNAIAYNKVIATIGEKNQKLIKHLDVTDFYKFLPFVEYKNIISYTNHILIIQSEDVFKQLLKFSHPGSALILLNDKFKIINSKVYTKPKSKEKCIKFGKQNDILIKAFHHKNTVDAYRDFLNKMYTDFCFYTNKSEFGTRFSNTNSSSHRNREPITGRNLDYLPFSINTSMNYNFDFEFIKSLKKHSHLKADSLIKSINPEDNQQTIFTKGYYHHTVREFLNRRKTYIRLDRDILITERSLTTILSFITLNNEKPEIDLSSIIRIGKYIKENNRYFTAANKTNHLDNLSQIQKTYLGKLSKVNSEYNLNLEYHQLYAILNTITNRNSILKMDVGLGKARSCIAYSLTKNIKHTLMVTEAGNVNEVVREFVEQLKLPAPHIIKNVNDCVELKQFNVVSYNTLGKVIKSKSKADLISNLIPLNNETNSLIPIIALIRDPNLIRINQSEFIDTNINTGTFSNINNIDNTKSSDVTMRFITLMFNMESYEKNESFKFTNTDELLALIDEHMSMAKLSRVKFTNLNLQKLVLNNRTLKLHHRSYISHSTLYNQYYKFLVEFSRIIVNKLNAKSLVTKYFLQNYITNNTYIDFISELCTKYSGLVPEKLASTSEFFFDQHTPRINYSEGAQDNLSIAEQGSNFINEIYNNIFYTAVKRSIAMFITAVNNKKNNRRSIIDYDDEYEHIRTMTDGLDFNRLNSNFHIPTIKLMLYNIFTKEITRECKSLNKAVNLIIKSWVTEIESESKKDSDSCSVKEKYLSSLLDKRIGLVVYDECQAQKNIDSTKTHAAMQMRCKNYLFMSATPIGNHISELQSYTVIANGPRSLKHSMDLRYRFYYQDYIKPYTHKKIDTINMHKNFNIIDIDITNPKGDMDKKGYPLMHITNMVDRNLTSVTRNDESIVQGKAFKFDLKEYKITSKPSENHMLLYAAQMEVVYEAAANNKYTDSREALTTLTNLIKISEVPSLISSDFASVLTSKQKDIVTLTTKQLNAGRSVIVFASFIESVNILANAISKVTDKKVYQLADNLNPSQRFELIDAFRKGKENSCIVGTVGNLGKGYNLGNADVIILSDIPWSSLLYTQSIGRILRPDQKGTPEVYMLVNKYMIDMYKFDTIQAKINMSKKHLDKDKSITTADTEKTDYRAFILNLLNKAISDGVLPRENFNTLGTNVISRGL